MKERKLEDIYKIYQSLPLSKPSHIQKNIEQDLPSNPIDRCHQRWADLFFGVWRALYERKPALIFGLLESMKSHGLIEDDYLSADLFCVNPPDDILKRVRTFRTSAVIPKLKGKKIPPWKRYDLFCVLSDYFSVLNMVKTLQRKRIGVRNPNSKIVMLKNRLPEILSHTRGAKRNNVPDRFLKVWINKRLPPGELAARLVAYLHELEYHSFQKRLTQARKKYVEIAHLLKYGV